MIIQPPKYNTLFPKPHVGLHQQSGFLLIAAIMIIIVTSIIGAALVSLFLRSTVGTTYLQAIPAAEDLAFSGLEQAIHSIYDPNIMSRHSCTETNGTVLISNNQTFSYASSNTQFTTGTLLGSYLATDNPTTLSVVPAYGSTYPSSGRVIIQNETFSYTNAILNGSAYILSGVSRAQDNTVRTCQNCVIPNAQAVGQYQCTITSTGSISSANNAVTRGYTLTVQLPMITAITPTTTYIWNTPFQPLTWTAANPTNASTTNKNSAISTSHNYTGEIQSTTNSKLSTNTLYFVSVLPNVFAPASTPYTTNFLKSSTGQGTVNAVDYSTNYPSAVGTPSGSGTVFAKLAFSSLPQSTSAVALNDIYTYAPAMDSYPTQGLIVGGSPPPNPTNPNAPTNGVIFYYNGSAWKNLAPTVQIGAIQAINVTPVLSPNFLEAFFAGKNTSTLGQLTRVQINNGNPISWDAQTLVTPLNDVAVVSSAPNGVATMIFAVGNRSMIYQFNSKLQLIGSAQLGASSENLNTIFATNPNDIWVGASTGNIYHYNGSSWVIMQNLMDNVIDLSGTSYQTSPLGPSNEIVN